MSFLNLPTPFPVQLDAEYLYNLESHQGEKEPGVLLALEAYSRQPVTGVVLLKSGATFHDLPLEAFAFRGFERIEIERNCYCDSPSENARLETLPLPRKVKVFTRQGSVIGTGSYLHTITWAQDNETLHVIVIGGSIILHPPHKVLFGENTADQLPAYRKWRQYDNVLGL